MNSLSAAPSKDAETSSNSARPKAVVFDLGKVMLDFDIGIFIKKIASRSRISESALHELLDQSPLLLRFEKGDLTSESFLIEVQRASGFSGDVEELAPLFTDIFTPIAPMIDLLTQLRAHGIPTCVFSNTSALATEHIRRSYGFFNCFTHEVLSFEHRAMKPDPKLYEVVERVTNLRENDLLYLDDRQENIVTGAARRWRVIHHVSPESSIAQLRSTGLLD